MKKIIFLALICATGLIFSQEASSQRTGETQSDYHIQVIKVFHPEGYILERRIHYVLGLSIDIFPTYFTQHQRIQLRNKEGLIIAYTPTRIKAVDYCPDLQHCYVFTWKTAFPFPSVFKMIPEEFKV